MRVVHAALLLLLSAPVSAREWTDVSGRFHCEATFLKLDGDTVQLQPGNTRTIYVPLTKLCAADRTFIEALSTHRVVGGDQVRLRTVVTKIANVELPAGVEVPRRPFSLLGAAGASSLTRPAIPQRESAQTGQLSFINYPCHGSCPIPQCHPHPHPHPQPPQPTVFKRVYTDCKITFHLITNVGTGTYWKDCYHWLTYLKYHSTDGVYWFYTPSWGDPDTIWWAFEINPSYCDQYRVWRIGTHSSNVYYAYLEKPY